MKIVVRAANNCLHPADAVAHKYVGKLKYNEEIMVEARRPRNIRQLRKYWVMVDLVFENQEHFRSEDDLSDSIKLAVGLTKTVRMPSGEDYRIPLSIAIEAMPQDEFDDFYNRAVNYVCTEVVPGLNSEDLEQEMMGF